MRGVGVWWMLTIPQRPFATPVFAGLEMYVCTRFGPVVLRRVVESDEDGHESRGGNGSPRALYWLRGWRLRMASWEKIVIVGRGGGEKLGSPRGVLRLAFADSKVRSGQVRSGQIRPYVRLSGCQAVRLSVRQIDALPRRLEWSSVGFNECGLDLGVQMEEGRKSALLLLLHVPVLCCVVLGWFGVKMELSKWAGGQVGRADARSAGRMTMEACEAVCQVQGGDLDLEGKGGGEKDGGDNCNTDWEESGSAIGSAETDIV